MTKTTLTEQINAIAFDTLTSEQFDFLKERALKSVRNVKRNGERKPTRKQRENETLKAKILESIGEGMTATEVAHLMGEMGADVRSVQKASALLKQMVDAGTLVRVQDKKTVIFKPAESEDDEVQALPHELWY